MKPLSVHHCLHQLAVPLLHLDPCLSGSSVGLLFPCIVLGTFFFLCDSTTVMLAFILTADRFGKSSQKDGRLTNQWFLRFKCSAHEGV